MSPEKLNIATVSPSSHLPIALAGRGDYTRKLFATADSVGLRHGVRGHFVVIERGLRARLPQLTRACDFVIDAMHDQPESAGPQVDFVAQNRIARHAKGRERADERAQSAACDGTLRTRPFQIEAAGVSDATGAVPGRHRLVSEMA